MRDAVAGRCGRGRWLRRRRPPARTPQREPPMQSAPRPPGPPRDEAWDTVVGPGGGWVADASNVTCGPDRGADGLNVKSGCGLPLFTSTSCPAGGDDFRPASSVTINVTL